MKSHRKKHFHAGMALQTDNPPTTPSAQVVGNAFIHQYYLILHQTPELVFRFYQDSSVLSRPDSNGVMTTVKTMQGIKKKILSLDYKNYEAEIKTADAQESHQSGVTVLVTGCLTSKDNLRRKFAQTFFLAPQHKGYFVLNDVFRYVEDGEPLENQPINDSNDSPKVHSIPDPYPATTVEKGHQNITEKADDPSDREIQSVNEKEVVVDSQPHSINGTDDAPRVHSIPDPEPTNFFDLRALDQATYFEQWNHNVTEKAYDPSDCEIQSVNEKKAVVDSQPHSNWNDDSAVVESAASSAQEDRPKKYYASIVSSQMKIFQLAAFLLSYFLKFYSYCCKAMKGGFGPIKQGGIQVRNIKQQGYCFGFVEFHSLSSMNNAIQVPPTIVEVSGSVKSISDSASWSLSMKERSRDLISLISGRNSIHHSSTPEISSMSTIPNPEEINGAFEALKTLLDKPAVEVFNNPVDRDRCRQLVIMLSSHHTSLEKRIILYHFSSRLPEFEKNIPTSVSTRESALVIRDSNLPGANEPDTVLEQGKASVSSLQYKFDELTQRHDTLTEKIRKLETESDQVQRSITETAAQLENLHQKVSSDYNAWEAFQQQTINAGKDLIHAENTIAEIEFAWSTLKNRLFPFSS